MVKDIILDVMPMTGVKFTVRVARLHFSCAHPRKFPEKRQCQDIFRAHWYNLYSKSNILMCFLCSTILGFLEIEETFAFHHTFSCQVMQLIEKFFHALIRAVIVKEEGL